MTTSASAAQAGKSGPTGITVPSIPRWARSTGPTSPIATRSDSLERFPLRDVVNDTRSRGFCGPTAVAAIVGQPISLVRDAFRLVRDGRNWINRDRAPVIRGTSRSDVRTVLELFGFTGHWHSIGHRPTLAAYLDERTGLARTHPCIVGLTGHWVALSGWQFCDTFSKGQVVDADIAPRRRARVRSVFIITGHCVPAADIPRKKYRGR